VMSSTTQAAAAAPSGTGNVGSGASDIKIKMPIQVSIPNTEEKSSMGGLKSYTAYCVNISDFGRQYTIERRFDDFQKLHADLTAVDRSLPALPEKKMFSSTDAATVAERKPAFEKLLRYMLRSEDVVFEPGMLVWKFLDLSTPAMVAARYLFKSRRLSYVKQTGKLLDQKYLEEHSYRLCHESILKTNLHLLSTEGMLVASGVSEPSESASTPGADAATARKNDADMETAVIEMIRHAVGQGGEEARKCFLEDNGLATMLRLLLRIAKRPGGGSTPDERVRKVLNALIHGEGDRYPEVFANFLAGGGVAIFAEFQELCAEHTAFAEFIGKALWLAWDLETQRAFLEGDSSSGAQALALLSSVFASGTRSSQIIAGLLISSLIANGLFASNADREAQAAAGIEGLVEELITAMPTFLGSSSATRQQAHSEDIQNAEAFIVSQGRNEKAFARITSCIAAPCDSDGSVAHEASGVWSACAFTLWCLVKIHPKPVRITNLRKLAPTLARCGTARVRWLAGELLLQIHVATSCSVTGDDFSADVASQEQSAVEVTMSEQIAHTVRQLEDALVQNRDMMAQQEQLAESRQEALPIAADGSWSGDLSNSLKRLVSARQRLSDASSTNKDIETTSTSALGNLSSSLQVDAHASVSDMETALQSVQELEHLYFSKRSELRECEEALQDQSSTVEQFRRGMEEADGAVSATRKEIAAMEQDLSGKQREAQQQRTIASSDLSSQRAQAATDMEEVERKLEKLREHAKKIQETKSMEDPQVQEQMTKLKQQAGQLKQRRAELQVELNRTSIDPATAQENALRLEREADELRDKLNFVRSSELYGLEQTHASKREAWQQESGRLQELRHMRDNSERESNELKRQVDDRWRVWQPLWSARLNRWHERAAALGQAQVHNHQFSQSVGNNWDVFREEQTARHEVLDAIARAQDSLAQLSRQLVEIPDL